MCILAYLRLRKSAGEGTLSAFLAKEPIPYRTCVSGSRAGFACSVHMEHGRVSRPGNKDTPWEGLKPK